MPYHVLRFRSETGDSKRTVDWAANLADAYAKMNACKDGHRDSHTLDGYGYYIRDIRNGTIYR